MVCPAAEAAHRVAQLFDSKVVFTVISSRKKCNCRHSADFLVFDALLAVAAAQESLRCITQWRVYNMTLFCHDVKLKIVASKDKALRQSLEAAVKQASLAEVGHISALKNFLFYFASKNRSKKLLSTVLTLLCRLPNSVNESIATSLSKRTVDRLLSRCNDCYDGIATFVTTFQKLILSNEQIAMLLEATLKRPPNLNTLGAAAEVLNYDDLGEKVYSDIALWVVNAPDDAASATVDVYYGLARHKKLLPNDQLERLATLLPQSSKLFKINRRLALRGYYSGMNYLESAAQLDNSLIPLHVRLLKRLGISAFDASLRVCNRPGYRALWRRILYLVYSKKRQNNRQQAYEDNIIFEPRRPLLEKLRQEYLDLVVGQCDYSPQDLRLLSKIKLGPCPTVGYSKACRAKLLSILINIYNTVKINCIQTSCEMAVVMQPGHIINIHKCKKNHFIKQDYFDQPAKDILRTSKNSSEILAVLDAHKRPFQGLRYIENCIHEAAVYLFDSHDMDNSQSRQRRVYKALGQIHYTHLQNQEPPKWKEVAVACWLALRHGCAPDSTVSARLEPPSSLVTEYALARDESFSDIQKLYSKLGPLAPIALCATKMFSGDLDDALWIARDPRAPEIAKYHRNVFTEIAKCIARNAIRLVKNNVSITQIAWVFEYLPRK